MPGISRRGRRAALGVLAATAIGALTLTGIPQGTAAPTPPDKGGDQRGDASSRQRERKGDFDARVGTAKERLRIARDTAADQTSATKALTEKLGSQGVVEMDSVTGTPTTVGRLDGFLTKRSSAKASTVALRYVGANAAGLGLTKADLKTLSLRRDYVDVAGIHHLSWTQSVHGIKVFGNGLKANVTKSGQLISVQGAPVSGLAKLARQVETTPALSATQARSAAARDVGGATAKVKAKASKSKTTWANADQAQLVWFVTGSGLRLGWSTYVQAGGDQLNYQHVIDAQTGGVLYRRDAVDHDKNPTPTDAAISRRARSEASNKGNALVFDNYPGAPRGGTQKVFNLLDNDLLSPYATQLSGKYVNAFADVNDNDLADTGETVAIPGANSTTPQYKLVAFNDASSLCSNQFVCTWDPDKPQSWATNKAADVTQGFYFNSIYHDYLAAEPFSFTRAAGNFEAVDGDAVSLNALDGANTANGLPDGDHIDNANMSTPPDGIPPRMQMYLFHAPGASDEEDPSLPTSSSFDSSVILHEYTHGLSNRLVVDADGNSTLNSIQAGSLGEAWSDYYAEDYLVSKGLEQDTSAAGDVQVGKYVAAGQAFRTMGLDCPVSTSSPACTAPFGGTGGYTYGDFARIAGTPEVHASGEIWAQTLWDLRTRLGHAVTGMLVTRAMELSPADPSFLDMRNAILQADLAVYGGSNRKEIWRTFADRGMGFFAGTRGSGDGNPVEDFSVVPSPRTLRSTVTGQVTDRLTGKPLAGALVSITGHNSGYVGDYSAVTDANGRYAIPRVFVGTYPLVTVFAPGYEALDQPLKVVPRGTVANFKIRRDWAASSGGGRIASFTGPDFTPDCGPSGAIDLSQSTGWGSTTGDNNATPTNTMIPKSIVVKLPATITLTEFAVDPSNTCGDPGSSSTGGYRIQTSPNGTTWTTAAQGTFTAANRGQLNPVPVKAPIANVGYVRFTMLSPQVPDFAKNCPDGAYGGCQFTDLTELEVFGTTP